MLKPLKDRESFTCTFNTTEECNLRCKYCYELNKKPRNLKIEDAKMFIDHIFTDPDPADLLNDPDLYFRTTYKKGLTFDFIGGDSFMNMPLLNQITEYALKKLWTTNETPNMEYWRRNFCLGISTNGTLFGNPEVRDWCETYKNILGIGVSIDGCPEIHDLNRIFKNGKGSMNQILKHWDWYRTTFPIQASETKATANKATIPYLFKSLKFFFEEMGIRYINQNFIMENMHLEPEDLIELERQLEKCVEYLLQHKHEIFWSMLDRQVADAHLSTGEEWYHKGWCGSGAMPALSVDGNIYPCIRWLPHTQVDKTDFIVGTAKDGFTHKENFKKVREGAYKDNCTKEEKCRTCPIESCCAYCIGGCYSEFGEFRRTTYSCEVNKILVKWAKIYWDEFDKVKGEK